MGLGWVGWYPDPGGVKAFMKREALAAIALHNVLKFGWTWQLIYIAFTLLNTNPEWL